MIVEAEKGSSLISITFFQFCLDGLHFIKKAIEFCVLVSEERFVLIERYGGETRHELIHRHFLEFGALHGFRTPCRIRALRPTLVRSSQSLPRRYSLGGSPPKSLLLVIYHPVISQCLNLGIRTRFSGPLIINFVWLSCWTELFSTIW